MSVSWLDHGITMMLLPLERICNDFIILHNLDVVCKAHRLKNKLHVLGCNPLLIPMSQNKSLINLLYCIYFSLFGTEIIYCLLDSEFLHYLRVALTNVKKDLQLTRLNKNKSTDHMHPKRSLLIFFFPLKSFHG